jgi:hypothetical protein
MRHPLRATVSALLAALALTSAGVPAEGGILLGLALGWLIAAALPDPRERVLHGPDDDDFPLHSYDG